MNVERHILRGLNARQFRGWQHFATLEPFGYVRDDYRTASIVAMIYNRSRGKDQKPMTLNDALLKFGEGEQRKEQTWQDKLLVAKLMAQQAAYFNRVGEREEG